MIFQVPSKIMAVVAALAILGLASSSSAVAPEPATIRLIDLTDEFDQFWHASSKLPEADRARSLQDHFREILPGFYDAARLADFGISPEKYAARLAKRISEYPQQREGIVRVSGEFAGLLAPAIKSFEVEFGQMRGYPPIYLVHSMGEFDGGTRDLPEGTRLLFGADVIDRLHKDTPIQPFFHHELFHLYHQPKLGPCKPLWCSLWAEGLAVHVASRLNPDASDAALLLNFPEPIRAKVEARREAAICAVRKQSNSTKPEDYLALFTGSGSPPDGLPVRTGYYVGFLVASDLGRDRSLKELADLEAHDVQPLIMESLSRLGSCAA